MSRVDWHELQFLESAGNAQELLARSTGRTPSMALARELTVCIQQGRLFFESAISGALEIQPLSIFYGVVGFAKALSIACTLNRLTTLPHSHGLSDISEQNARLDNLAVRIGGNGTFHHFDDAISELGRINYFEHAMPKSLTKPFGHARDLEGTRITIKEILARLPALEDLYAKTFQETPKTWSVHLHFWAEYGDYVELRIDDSHLFSNRDTLSALVAEWRSKCPFLEDWCLSEASLAWGNSILIFGNVDRRQVDEFSEAVLVESDGRFAARYQHDSSYPRTPFGEILPPLAGGIENGTQYFVQPIDGVYLSEYSLQFLGAFLLSSLVRYRPQVWQHAISRSVLEQVPADDRALALIQRFLELVLEKYPKMILSSIGESTGERA